MENGSTTRRLSKRELEEKEVEKKKPRRRTAGNVRIVLQKDVVLNYTGAITGRLYVFDRAGSIVPVDERDAEVMLEKARIESCCGTVSSPTFARV
jgi:hypothetical protein